MSRLFFVFDGYTCFLKPFIAALTRPYNNSKAVGTTNNHLIMVKIVATQASAAGVDGYIIIGVSYYQSENSAMLSL